MYPFSPAKLDGLVVWYHSPLFVSRKGNNNPHDAIPPARKVKFTVGGQIIPTPINVAEKSKKNLQARKYILVLGPMHHARDIVIYLHVYIHSKNCTNLSLVPQKKKIIDV